MADRNGGVFLDARAAENWIASLAWPRIYLDFEWDTFAFPPYDRMIPYDVLCFEFSMHVENEDGTIRHTGFFKHGDGRKEFIETLLKIFLNTEVSLYITWKEPKTQAHPISKTVSGI